MLNQVGITRVIRSFPPVREDFPVSAIAHPLPLKFAKSFSVYFSTVA